MDLLLFVVCFIFNGLATVSSAGVGVVYDPTDAAGLPPPRVVTAIQRLGITTVRLLNPTPGVIKEFQNSNITLSISIPNSYLHRFAKNDSDVHDWIYRYVLPFFPQTKISMITIGEDFFSPPPVTLVKSLRRLRNSLEHFELGNISVSTTLSLHKILTFSPPSVSEFRKEIFRRIDPIVEFLQERNSCLVLNIHPYYYVQPLQIRFPISFITFQGGVYHDNETVYHNLFEILLSSAHHALEKCGYSPTVPLIVTTGWPVNSRESPAATSRYAQEYLIGLLRFSSTSGWISARVEDTYIYKLFDDKKPQQWGIMFRNGSLKYDLLQWWSMSSTRHSGHSRYWWLLILVLPILCIGLLIAVIYDRSSNASRRKCH